MVVSIIVPVYHGQKYLKQIVAQTDACAKEATACNVELVLYNDCPDEKIYVENYKYIKKIKCINSTVNKGIHGARIEGLKNAEGEYIVFLDQDDRIKPEYVKSQLKNIKDSDASVCRIIHNNRFHYTDTFRFSDVISKKFLLNNWNSIVSPGQVMIKRSSIPSMWTKQVMKINGADDYLLWILMMLEDRKFALNEEILYEHVVTGTNISSDTNNMICSENEMFSILRQYSSCYGYDNSIWDELKESLRTIHIKELDNYKYSFGVIKQWIGKQLSGENPVGMLRQKNIKDIAVYGAGEFGLLLKNMFEMAGINVKFFIDRNARFIISDIPVYTIDETPDEIEAIVISLNNGNIKRDIQNKKNMCVVNVDELIR